MFTSFRNCTFIAVSLFGLLMPAGAASAPPAEVAITFDDLPVNGPLPPGLTRADVAKQFAEVLTAHKAPPVYGMLNAIALKWDPASAAALKVWRDAGNLLANHTYSHLGASKADLAAFEADVAANEPFLKEYMAGKDWHYLRLPFLDGGNTPEKRAAVAAYMDETGYRLADVTIAFNDYEYNPAYARCMAKNDAAGLAWLKAHYLAAAADAIDYSQRAAKNTFGRDIKHVYLLHFGAFEAQMLPAVLNLLENRHFTLVTLDEAQSDPVYKEYAKIATDWGGTLLTRAMAAKNTWVAAPANDTSATLTNMCP